MSSSLVSYSLFDTALGVCGIAWTELGIVRLQLPEGTVNRTEMRVAGENGRQAAPPPHVQDVIARLQAHMAGSVQSFGEVALDLSQQSPFHQLVYRRAQQIPPGQTWTYKTLAEAVGRAGSARAVGQAMARNPVAVIVPCHRIVATHGAGGFSAHGGLDSKARLLQAEVGSSLWQPGAMEKGAAWLQERDRVMAAVVETVGPCTMAQRCETTFSALAESIVYQQLAGKAALSIWTRLLAQFGGCLPEPLVLAECDEARLVAAGLSGAKRVALRELSHAFASGRLSEAMLLAASDDELRQALTSVRGIGPWTCDMFMIFHLGRPDVLPVGDLGVRKAAQRLYRLRELPGAERLQKLASNWRPYRTLATWYLWRSQSTVTLGQERGGGGGSPSSP